MRHFINKKRKYIKKIVIIAMWLGIWQAVYLIVGKDVLMPSPFTTFKELFRLLQDQAIYQDIVHTFYRVFTGIVLSFGLGGVCAVLAERYEWVKDFLSPFITLLKATPVMAVVMLALLWLNSSRMPILVCFLMCYPITYTNLLGGLQNKDQSLFEMAKVYQVNRKEFFFHLYLPSLRPAIYTTLSLAFGLGWKSVVAAEVLAAPKYAMGYHLLSAKIYLETERLFSWVILIVFFSTLLEKGLKELAKKDEIKYF